MTKSGIEMLEELLYQVQTLRKEIKILDQKVAHIANSTKIIELMNNISGTKFDDFARTAPKIIAADAPSAKPKVQAAEVPHKGIKNFNFEHSDAAKTNQPQANRRRENQFTLVSGKMITQINNKEVALSGLNVKIYNNNDELIKETKTNRAGTWISHLSKGHYVVNIEGQYKGQDLVPVNMPFEVKEGMKELEVK